MSTDSWLKRLQENGQRLTSARRAVVETVAASPRALTPLQIFDAARRRYRRLGLVSVYRTLELLEGMRLVQRVHRLEGCQAFIAASTGHQHLLVCRNCGRVLPFAGDDLQGLMASVSRKSGFQIEAHWLQFFGLCSDCQSLVGGRNAK
jgi:Fur family ferric uptake transcriptional regulator